MKNLLIGFCISTLFIAGMFSCKKETITNVTNTVHDTVCILPTKDELLVEKQWQVDEIYVNSSGTNKHYVRGGVNTTGVNYDNLKLRFLENGTGTYTDEMNVDHTLTWSFTSADKRNMTLTIGPPSPATFTWAMVELADNALHSTTAMGSNFLLTSRYIQVP